MIVNWRQCNELRFRVTFFLNFFVFAPLLRVVASMLSSPYHFSIGLSDAERISFFLIRPVVSDIKTSCFSTLDALVSLLVSYSLGHECTTTWTFVVSSIRTIPAFTPVVAPVLAIIQKIKKRKKERKSEQTRGDSRSYSAVTMTDFSTRNTRAYLYYRVTIDISVLS